MNEALVKYEFIRNADPNGFDYTESAGHPGVAPGPQEATRTACS
jgi:acetoacetate decarboxylase